MTTRILVVDDEADVELLVRQRFRKQIRDKTYAFVFARNGADALAHFQQDREIEVVMTDINMPVMDGLTLLTKLLELNPHVQPVMVSAYGDIKNIRTAMNRGAFDFVTKPIDFHDYELTIEKALKQVQMLKQGMQAREQLASVHRELNIARSIQQSILPQQLPTFADKAHVELHAIMLPARNVGGDLYDYFQLDADRLALVIGDVSGKGVPAAFFMAMCRTVLKSVAQRGMPPGQCLREVNDFLCQDNNTELFVTLFYGILNVRTGELHYSNAGHNPPYVLPAAGEPHMLNVDYGNMLLGVLPGIPYKDQQTVLQPGAGLLLYTDGVTEAMDAERKQFSSERLHAFLDQARGSSTQALAEGLVSAVQAFTGGAPQADDITVLAVRYR